MKKMKFVTLLLFVALCSCCTMLSAQNATEFSLSSDTEIVVKGVGQDGTKVLTVTAKGKKMEQAVEIAKRDAVAYCLFKGIPGSGSTEATPAIIKGGLTPENEEFFSSFLMLKEGKGKGGKYLRFVNKSGQPQTSKIKKGYQVSLDVQVLYDDLKDYMIKEGYAKSLDFLF